MDLVRFLGRKLASPAILAAAACLFGGPAAVAQTPPKGAVVHMSAQELHEHFKALGHRARGGISHDMTDSDDARYRALPHFSSSFTVGSATYPYTMVGHSPKSGRPARLRSVIIPLRMHFTNFGPNFDINVDFDPMPAVNNIVNSPLYKDARFPNGVGQFGDMMQRATFWNKMDEDRLWHVRMAEPIVTAPVDIEVTLQTGTLMKDSGGNYFGDVLIDFLDAEAKTIIQLIGIDTDEVPIFVTGNVTAQALGYHNAFPITNSDGTVTLQTMIYTSWLDQRLVSPLLADVSTANHEIAEWLNDPFVNNVVPDWFYPPSTDSRTVCSGNPFLEVGDPQGNGPTFDDFPTVVVPLHGYHYHLQQLVMLPWFADEKPSSAQNGWYTFPYPAGLTVPAVYCP